MIGSVTQYQQEQAEMLARREAIAARQTAAQLAMTPAPALPQLASVVAGGMPAAEGGSATAMVLKGAEPDIGKKRKGKDRERWVGHDLRDDPPGAAADADDAEAARGAGKAYQDRGATAGPGHSLMPGEVEPEDFQRDYLDAGHGAPSPESESPRTSPLPPQARGFPRPVDLSPHPAVGGFPGPLAEALATHQARVSMATPIPDGEAR